MYRNTDRFAQHRVWNMRQIAAADEKKVVGMAGIFMHSHPPSWLEDGMVA